MILKELLKEKNMRYEVYVNKGMGDPFHTDNITFIGSDEVDYYGDMGINTEKLFNLDEKLFDYEIMDQEDYENTILANSEEEITGEEFPVLVVSIKESIIDRNIK